LASVSDDLLLAPPETRAPSVWRRRIPPASFVVAAAILLLWELGARLGFLTPWFFPAPSSIAKFALQPSNAALLADGAKATLARVFIGVLCGAGPAAVLGMLIGWSDRLRRIVDPFLAALHPIPKIALLPLLIVIFGIGEAPKLIAISIGAFFPMALTVAAGTRQINRTFFEVARSYGATESQIFRNVVFPGSMPSLVVGVRLSFNVALLIAISTEIAASKSGLGRILWMAWETFRIEPDRAQADSLAARLSGHADALAPRLWYKGRAPTSRRAIRRF
jgi:NitT/TauT family transport system permease protein